MKSEGYIWRQKQGHIFIESISRLISRISMSLRKKNKTAAYVNVFGSWTTTTKSSMAVPFIESSASKISGEKGYYVMNSQKEENKNKNKKLGEWFFRMNFVGKILNEISLVSHPLLAFYVIHWQQSCAQLKPINKI